MGVRMVRARLFGVHICLPGVQCVLLSTRFLDDGHWNCMGFMRVPTELQRFFLHVKCASMAPMEVVAL